MVRHAFAQQSGLRDEGALGVLLQQDIRLALVVRIAMRAQRELGQYAAHRVDARDVQVGLDDDFFSRGDRGGGRAGHRRNSGRRDAVVAVGEGRALPALGKAGAVALCGTGGR